MSVNEKECHPGRGRLSALPLELLRGGFCIRLRVTGRSMVPYLADDDLVTIEPLAAASIRTGDLVYTQQPGLPPLLHRVIDRVRGKDGGWTVLTKGDALVTRDPAVHADFVAGRVVSILRPRLTGSRRVVRLKSGRRLLLQRCLALGSRHAPRSFAAISRRLVPLIERIAGWASRRS